MHVFALAGDTARRAVAFDQESGAAAAFQINLFWIIVAATTFIFFFALIRVFAFSGIVKTLEDRRARIEQGLKDADQAAHDRKSAEEERLKALQDARREAQDILGRAQKVSEETRARDLAATREEIDPSARTCHIRDRGREAARPRPAPSRGRGPRAGRGVQGRRRIARRSAAASTRTGVPGRDRHPGGDRGAAG